MAMGNSNGSVQAARDSDNMLKLLVSADICAALPALLFLPRASRGNASLGVCVLPDCNGRTEGTYAQI